MYLSHDETWHGVWSVQLLEKGNRMEVLGKPSTCDQEPLVKLSAFVDLSCTSLVRAASSEIVGQ